MPVRSVTEVLTPQSVPGPGAEPESEPPTPKMIEERLNALEREARAGVRAEARLDYGKLCMQ